MNRRSALAALGAALCGFAWGHQGAAALAALAAFLPLLWGLAGNRLAAGLIAAAYFLAASRGLPVGVGIFFAASAPAWFGWVLWAVAAAVNALPWALLWHRTPGRRAWGALAAVVLTALPPIGWMGWVNPVDVAGWWYPGMRFVGLAFMGGLAMALAARRWPVVGMLVGASVIANVNAVLWPPRPPAQLAAWSAQDTAFPRLQSANADVLGDGARVVYVMQLAQAMKPGQVLVLPETVLPAKGSASFAWMMLDGVSQQLKAKGATILAGTEVHRQGLPMLNVLTVLGGAGGEMVQRVPVPIGMWRPWERRTFAAEPFGSGVAELHGVRVAYSVCYEQLLTYPMIVSLAHAPAVLIGAANDWWARGTSIPAIQGQVLDAWGRLFRLPVLRATNL